VRPVTKELLATLSYGTVLHASPQRGPCGGRPERWRTNGQLKTWKTRPDEFRQPIKHGLYDYSYIDEGNAYYFHLEADCEH
jgi:hypothetical protein